jgi:hypothetical protein
VAQLNGHEPQNECTAKTQSLPRQTNPVALAKLLEEWMSGDLTEQRDTFEFLRHALDEHRPTGYKLFSKE